MRQVRRAPACIPVGASFAATGFPPPLCSTQANAVTIAQAAKVAIPSLTIGSKPRLRAFRYSEGSRPWSPPEPGAGRPCRDQLEVEVVEHDEQRRRAPQAVMGSIPAPGSLPLPVLPLLACAGSSSPSALCSQAG